MMAPKMPASRRAASVASSRDWRVPPSQVCSCQVLGQHYRLIIRCTADPSEPNSSSVTCLDEARERPAPNPKLNLKTSISSYWKVLFNRQKAAARQGVENEQPSELNDEMTEMQQVQQGQQTDPVKFDDVATIVTPKTSFHDLTTNNVDIEEVHMLPISNETSVSPLQKKMKD